MAVMDVVTDAAAQGKYELRGKRRGDVMSEF
jgi:hypothetical protein